MKHGSLFSGIGGFDLAAEWMGWDNVFHCEWNEFGQKVLKHYWPEAISYADITKSDFSIHRGTIDILTGGFPCQPYSQAGKRLGKEDDRHLWPEMLRAIGEIQPRWVVGENVRGLTNWNGGLVFDEVQADLEAKGYEILPFLLPACAVNAPHRRDRIWFIAYAADNNRRPPQGRWNEAGQHVFGELERPGIFGTSANTGRNGQQLAKESEEKLNMEREGISFNELNALHGTGFIADTANAGTESLRRERENSIHGFKDATNSNNERLQGRGINGEHRGQGQELHDEQSFRPVRSQWEVFPTQSPVCDGNDGLSSRLDGITFSKWRNESIKAGGNAIVPQVAHQIFKAIEQYDHPLHL